MNRVKLQETIKQEKSDSENKVLKELEAEIKTLQNRIDEHEHEIKDLKHANVVVREIHNKVH